MNPITRNTTQKEIYHYTTLDAVLGGLIRSNPDSGKEICLWASNTLYLNDTSETQIGFKELSEIRKYSNEQLLDSRIDEVLGNIFSLSFSTQDDFLPMWGIYGKNGQGLMLKFDSNYFVAPEHSILNCIYEGSESHLQIKANMKNTHKINGGRPNTLTKVNPRLVSTASITLYSNIKSVLSDSRSISTTSEYLLLPFILKDKSFSFENEMRICVIEEDKSKVSYRSGNNLTIPYIKLHFPKEALTEIIIGPTNDFERSKFSLKMFLDSRGFNHVKISESKVPYRG